jgi:hypothetical protein
MPGKRICSLFAICVFAAFAQQVNQTFVFSHVGSPQALQEYLNAIQGITQMKSGTANWAEKWITVTGTEEQISLATWMAKELNDAPARLSAMMRHDYPGTVSSDQEVKIYYLAHTASAQEMQEVVNLTRSIADIRYFLPVQALGAIVARGTPADIDTSEWLLTELDRPAEALPPGHVEHAVPNDSRYGLAQIYVFKNVATPQALQEAVNGTRSLADIQRCFPYNSHKVLAMRGSLDQIAFADWTLDLLDRPASAPADATVHEYKYNTGYARDTGTIARVFFLNPEQSPLRLMQTLNEVRTATSIQRMYPNNQAKAIMMRGTGDQISRAEQMLKDK